MDPEIVTPELEVAADTTANEEVNPPTGETITATPPVTEDTPDAKQPASMLEAVQAAISKDQAATSSDADGKVEPDPQPEAVEAQAEPAKPEDDAKLPFHTHPRFKQLTEERKAYKAEVENLKPDAEQFRQIRQVQEQFGISNNEMADTIKMATLLKTDPMQALEILGPLYEQLSEMAGKKLPADIQVKVDEGKLDVADAQEMATARAQAALAQQRVAQTEAQIQQQRQADVLSANREAVVKWEAQMRSTDPDYKAKESFLTVETQALIARFGAPKNPQESLELVQTAHANVTARLKAIQPPRPATRTLTSDRTAAAPNVSVQPKTMAEAIRMAANKR